MTWNDEKYGERKEYDTNVEYHPYQRNEDESERSRSGENSKGKIISNRPADPAQSAPSAEPLSAERFWTLHYEEDDEWFRYELDDTTRESVFKFAEAYAALRTAQLEEELHDAYVAISECTTDADRRANEAQTRADTAESALARQKQLTIDDIEEMAGYIADTNNELGSKVLKVAAYLVGMKIRVAAQTPEEK